MYEKPEDTKAIGERSECYQANTAGARNLDFLLKTLDGDEAISKEIQFECNKLLEENKVSLRGAL